MSESPKIDPIPNRFSNRVAIVTGGTDGIGRAAAMELLREGAAVVASALPSDIEGGKRAFGDAGFQPTLLAGDMADEGFRREIVAETAQKHGRVDYLVNNAFSFLAKSTDATRADFQYSFDVGPIGFAAMIQLVAPEMKKQGGGAVVNVSSISAYVAQTNRWTYNMSKGAVTQLTRCAALDLAPDGIRVNSVSPGWIWTRETEKAAGNDKEKFGPIWGQYHMLNRMAYPIEIARPILFLLSDDASFITGTNLPVDGGYNGLGPEGLGQTAVVAGSR